MTKYPGPGYIQARRNPGAPLDFHGTCPHCGYAYVYPAVDFASGEIACIWCADREQRPECWRFTARQWERYRARVEEQRRLRRIAERDGYPVLKLEVRR